MKTRKTTLLVVTSIFVLTTCAFSIYRTVRHVEVEKLLNPEYVLDTIIQTGPVKEALPTVLLSELVDLSCNKESNYFAFHERRAERKLLNCPVITKAKVKKIKPNKVYIDYELRRPIALFTDFENMAIDEERRLFPLSPYYSPKELCEIVLGEHRFTEIVSGEKIDLAFKVLGLLARADLGEHAFIRRVDVSKAFSQSYGKREIVVIIDHLSERHYLRMTKKVLVSGIANYVSLVKGMPEDTVTRVVDLRIEKLAYVEDILEKQ